MVPSLTRRPCWDLVIRNTGRTAARDIHIDADPWPALGDRYGDLLREHLTRPFDMAPGTSVRFTWRVAHEHDQPDNPDQPAGMPAEVTLTLRYHGDDPAMEPFTDTRFLDAPTRAGIIPAPGDGATSRDTSAAPEVTLKNIENALRNLNSHVAELRR